MFGKANDRTLLARTVYKRYFDKNVRIAKRSDTSVMVFLGRPKHEPKTAKERDEKIVMSKLLPKSTCPFRVIRTYPGVIVVDQVSARLPVSLDQCSKYPAKSSTQLDPNFESDLTNPPFTYDIPSLTKTLSFSSEDCAYHPSESADAQAPVHIFRRQLDPKTASDLNPILNNTPDPIRP